MSPTKETSDEPYFKQVTTLTPAYTNTYQLQKNQNITHIPLCQQFACPFNTPTQNKPSA